jgi:hypothetical protein
MITRRELLKSAIATATVRIAKEESEAMEQRHHRQARGQGPRPYRKGSSESILTSSLAGDTARCFLNRRQRHRWGLEGMGQLPRFLTENALRKDLLFS